MNDLPFVGVWIILGPTPPGKISSMVPIAVCKDGNLTTTVKVEVFLLTTNVGGSFLLTPNELVLVRLL